MSENVARNAIGLSTYRRYALKRSVLSVFRRIQQLFFNLIAAFGHLSTLVSSLGLVAVTIVATYIVLVETRESETYIAPFELPASLKQNGWTEDSVSRALREQMQEIRATALDAQTQFSQTLNVQMANTSLSNSNYDLLYTGHQQLSDLPPIFVPGGSISLSSLAAYLRAVSWLPQHRIVGEIEEIAPRAYCVHVGFNGMPVYTSTVPNTRVAELIHDAAVSLESEYEPDLAALYLSQNAPDQAIKLLTRFLATRATSPRTSAWAFNLWGNILRGQSRYLDAVDKYQLAILLAPKTDPIAASAHSNLGYLYLLVRDFKGAWAEFRNAIRIDEDARSYRGLGVVAAVQNQPGSSRVAAYYFAKAMTKDPSYAPAYSDMGRLLGQGKDWRRSFTFFRKAIGIKPAFPDLYRNFATVEFEHNMLDQSLSNLLNAAEFESWNNKFTLGDIEEGLAKYVDQHPLSDARRGRALGICARLSKAVTSMPGGSVNKAFETTIAKALSNPRCKFATTGESQLSLSNYPAAPALPERRH